MPHFLQVRRASSFQKSSMAWLKCSTISAQSRSRVSGDGYGTDGGNDVKRWSANLLYGLSLLIFLLAMGIWIRSYFAGSISDRPPVQQRMTRR